MSRMVPEAVLAAVRGYDSRLGLRWDARQACWYFTFNGEDAWVYMHLDGSYAKGDITAGEALEIVKQHDGGLQGPLKTQAMRAVWERKKQKEREEAAALMAAARKEAAAVARTHFNGAQVYV